MDDYLGQIDDAKAEIARLKGEKEAFEQCNPPEDADEEELAEWNYAKDLERRIRELKAEHKDELKKLAKLEKAAAKGKATAADRKPPNRRTAVGPVLDQLAALEAESQSYEQLRTDLAAARGGYRDLTNAFVGELRQRSATIDTDQKQAPLSQFFLLDVQARLGINVNEMRQFILERVENIWNKYRVPLTGLSAERDRIHELLRSKLDGLSYV